MSGPSPDVDLVLSILLQSNISTGQPGKQASGQQVSIGTTPSTSDLSGSSRTRLNPNGLSHRLPTEGLSGKRKDTDSMLSLTVSSLNIHKQSVLRVHPFFILKKKENKRTCFGSFFEYESRFIGLVS